jgi:hypothetical protein
MKHSKNINTFRIRSAPFRHFSSILPTLSPAVKRQNAAEETSAAQFM